VLGSNSRIQCYVQVKLKNSSAPDTNIRVHSTSVPNRNIGLGTIWYLMSFEPSSAPGSRFLNIYTPVLCQAEAHIDNIVLDRIAQGARGQNPILKTCLFTDK